MPALSAPPQPQAGRESESQRPEAPPGLEPLLIDIDGMKCASCVRAVEQRLMDQPGVRQASVNLLTRTAWVELELASTRADQAGAQPGAALLQALAGLGFAARLRDGDDGEPFSPRQQRQQRSWWQQWRQLMVALLLLLVSGLGHVGLVAPTLWTGPAGLVLTAEWFHALVATAALLGPGRGILIHGVRSALAGMPSMDTLVGLGVSSAYGASVVGLLWPASGWPCFFNEPVMLLGFVLLGRFLEERARFRTGRALEQLAELQPDTALLLFAGGPPRPVRVGGLRPGDRVQLLPGDRVPVDALVLEGASAVDVSALTGEPLPLQAGRRQRAGRWQPQPRSPPGAGGAAQWRRERRGPDHSNGGAGPVAQGADPGPHRSGGRSVHPGGAGLGHGHLPVLVVAGHLPLAPRAPSRSPRRWPCWPRRVWGLGRNPLQPGAAARHRRAGGGLSLRPGPGHPHGDHGEFRIGGALWPAVSGWRCD